jgi:GNAT superfamily N-acetyltransferase
MKLTKSSLDATTIRAITSEDAALIAHLHITSWRSAYRGILRDEYLDADWSVKGCTVWDEKLRSLSDDAFGVIALRADEPVGFCIPDAKGTGIGRTLLRAVAVDSRQRDPAMGLHLFVYELNHPAIAFYTRIGGVCVERTIVDAPDGQQLPEWRYAWSSPDVMLQHLGRT